MLRGGLCFWNRRGWGGKRMEREKSCPDHENRASLREIYSLIQCPLLWELNYFSDCFLSPHHPHFRKGKIFYIYTAVEEYTWVSETEWCHSFQKARVLLCQWKPDLRSKNQTSEYIFHLKSSLARNRIKIVLSDTLHSSLDCMFDRINSGDIFIFKHFRYELLKLYLIGRNRVGTPSGTYLNFPR